MCAATRLRPAILACTVLAAAAGAGARVPDRDATLILPPGMLVAVDRATFYDDGGVIEMQVRNTTYEVTRARLRIVVFDERLRLKGSVAYCTGLVQPGTRQPVRIPLEVKSATAADSFAVVVEEVLTPRRTYTLRESTPLIVEQARRAVDLRGWSLSIVEAPRAGAIPPCPCECEEGERRSREGCGPAGPEAFTCTPMLPGCSHGFTCKR